MVPSCRTRTARGPPAAENTRRRTVRAPRSVAQWRRDARARPEMGGTAAQRDGRTGRSTRPALVVYDYERDDHAGRAVAVAVAGSGGAWTVGAEGGWTARRGAAGGVVYVRRVRRDREREREAVSTPHLRCAARTTAAA
jgi:hypothetical protein